MPSHWGVTPRASVEEACRVYGEPWVVDNCLAILRGQHLSADVGYVLAGPPSRSVLAGLAGGLDGYWPRVWALRGLLYAWGERAVPLVIAGLADESWRVREMAAKVVARRRIGDALDEVARLQGDPVPRVRAAAARAIVVLVDSRA